MHEIFQKFDKVVSLGYNCYTKLFLSYKKIDQETHFFDYIGTSAWSIVDMFENDFDGVFDTDQYKLMHVMKKGPDSFLVVNDKYFIRCKHEFKKTLEVNFRDVITSKIDKKELRIFLEKMQRRKERFLDLLKSNDSILFIRYEEDPTGRERLEQYDDKNKTQLVIYLKQIMTIFQKFNPEKKIFLIDLSHRHLNTEYIKDFNIIKIKLPDRIHKWEFAHSEIDKALEDNKEFISSILQ